MSQSMRDHPLFLGLIGTGSSWGTAIYSFIDQARPIVSFCSAIVGLVIGIMTLYAMRKKYLRDEAEHQKKMIT